MKKYKNKIVNILLIIFILLFVYSSVNIIFWFVDNAKLNELMDAINKITTIKEVDAFDNGNCEDCGDLKYLDVDFKNLLKINDETVGWIKVDGTEVNYPIVQHSNNRYYLKRSFDKSRSNAGWVFLDYRNNINDLSENTIIYAHGRANRKMFGSLRDTLDKKWFNKMNYHVIKISTLEKNYIFQIFSIYTIRTTNDYLYINFNEIEKYIKFLNKLKNRSIHNFDVLLDENDKIITLSTCYNNSKKLVLHAKLINSENK